jgi:flagellar hook-associated protein 2
MSSILPTSSNTTNQLDPYFTNIINSIMTVEAQPLDTLSKQQDQISVQKGAYSDLSTELTDLQNASWALQNSYTSSVKLGATAAMSGVASGYTVASASADSSAIAGVYSLQINKLAQAQTVYSERQATADQALTFGSGSAGSFTLGDATFTVTQGVGITYTSASGGTASVSGTSLNALATAINNATYTSGSGVSATVVDNHLVLTSQTSGSAGAILASDLSNDGSGAPAATGLLHDLGILASSGSASFQHVYQDAQDAEFTVNGISVKRSQNTGLTDVISGVTLNLAGDATGKSATITVSAQTTDATSAINDFLTKFNTLSDYLQSHTATTSSTVNGVTTYTRGTLADDTIFNDLRQNMLESFMSDFTNGGTLNNLRQMGLSIDDNLHATVKDSNALQTALTSNLANSQKLLGAFANQMDSMLSGFTGRTSAGATGTGYLKVVQDSMASQSTNLSQSITDLTARLTTREQSLISEYANLQASLYLLQYQQQEWQTVSSYSTNITNTSA